MKFIWIIKTKPQKKTQKSLKWGPVATWFVVYSFKQGPLSIAYGMCSTPVAFSNWFTVDLFCQQHPCSLYNYSTWQLYQCGWSRAIILQLDFCTEYTECFFIFLFHLNHLPFQPSVEQEGLFSSCCICIIYEQEMPNWGVLELWVITSCQALNWTFLGLGMQCMVS